MSQIDHDRLREELRDLAPISRTPATPVPGVRGRIRTIRRRRIVTGSVVTLACAGLIAAVAVPAMQGGRTPAISPAIQVTTTPPPTTKATPPNTTKPTSGPHSTTVTIGTPAGSQVAGPGFEEFVEGKQGPGYVVLANGGTTVVSHLENGTGRPCLSVAGEGADSWPAIRFCVDENELVGNPKWATYRSENGGATLLVAVATDSTHDLEPVTTDGDSVWRYDGVRTKTAPNLRFLAVQLDAGVAIEKVVGHRSASEPSEGTEPPASKGKSTTTRAAGPGMEEYVAGKQGPGYVWNEGAEGGWAVAHRLDGDGAPCLTFEPAYDNARVCFDDWPPGENVRWVAKPRPGGGELIAGFTKLDVGSVEVLAADGESLVGLTPVATPTSGELAFFEVVTTGGQKVGRIVAR